LLLPRKCVKPDLYTSKETCKRNLHKRVIKETYTRDLIKRPAKETYMIPERCRCAFSRSTPHEDPNTDLHTRKETCKRDLQKNPTKET